MTSMSLLCDKLVVACIAYIRCVYSRLYKNRYNLKWRPCRVVSNLAVEIDRRN
jgi:hypothetical protein